MTLQTGLADCWSETGFEWPDWLAGYDDPVIRCSTTSRKKMHAPDLRAASPRPACSTGQRDTEMLFVVAERANIEPIYADCGCPECQQWRTDESDQ